jgi:hypothetical protein
MVEVAANQNVGHKSVMWHNQAVLRIAIVRTTRCY